MNSPPEPASAEPKKEPQDEFNIVASKVSLLGQQLRGAHAEFSDLKTNVERLTRRARRRGADLRARPAPDRGSRRGGTFPWPLSRCSDGAHNQRSVSFRHAAGAVFVASRADRPHFAQPSGAARTGRRARSLRVVVRGVSRFELGRRHAGALARPGSHAPDRAATADRRPIIRHQPAHQRRGA